MNTMPRVTIIVPCYNYGRFLGSALDSLFRQSLTDIEVIVIDDASTDDSKRVLARYTDDPRLRIVLHSTNLGHIATYNEGLSMARGEFVGLLSADDYYLNNDAILRQVSLFDANDQLGYVYASSQLVDEEGRIIWHMRPHDADYVRDGLEEITQLLFENCVPASGTLVRRRCHTELGDYDPTLPHAGDWEMWLRLATRYRVGYIVDPLVAYRVHATNMSHSRIRPSQANREVVRTITKTFDALPPSASDRLWRLRGTALQQAWLRTSEVDCGQGRVRRAWDGLADAAWHSPGLLATVAFYRLLAKVTVLTVIGHQRFVALTRWRAARRVRVATGSSPWRNDGSSNHESESVSVENSRLEEVS